MRLFSSWDEDKKKTARVILGVGVVVLAVYVLQAIISYLFTWQRDMSLGSTPLSEARAANASGVSGHGLGECLVGEFFGLGSLVLVFVLVELSIRLFTGHWHYKFLRTILIALYGAFVASLVLALVGKYLGLDYLFGGGLGGRCGEALVSWGETLIGTLPMACGLGVLTLLFFFFSSGWFSRWVAGLGVKKPKVEKEEVPAPVLSESPVPGDDVFREGDIVEDNTELVSKGDDSDAPAYAPEESCEAEPEVEQGVESEETPESDIGQGDVVPAASDTESEETPEDKGSFEIIPGTALDTTVKKELTPIDNRLDPPDGLPKYKFPSLDLLDNHFSGRREVSSEELTRNNNKIRAALANYKIQVNDVKAIVGPTVTLYKVYPAPGVKIADIKKLQEDIALSLNAKGVRVVTLSDSVGIEVANDYSSIVPLKAMLNDEAFRTSKAYLPVAIGYTITQKVKVFDLADAPHLLIAGATKQGKSVGLNVIVSSLLYSKHPSELKFVFIDPKMVEFSSYASLLKHYLAVMPDSCSEEDEKSSAIVKKAKDAERVLRSLCEEMDERYELLSKAGVNNISLYNGKYKDRRLRPDHGHRFLPYLVVVVDEYADLTMTVGASPEVRASSRSITNSIVRLAQKGRAAGLHVILATQRPSVDVISGIIKSNFPMRIAFRVASRVDSMTILDSPGAEKLIGRGDMLFSAGIDTERIQCAYIAGDEIDRITGFIGDQTGHGRCYNTPYYLPEMQEAGSDGSSDGAGSGVDMRNLDERFEEAARMVVTSQRGSTSDLQRKLGMGYAKAGRVMDQLEAAGVVGPQEGSKPRQVLIPDLNTLQPILDAFLHR